MENFLPLRREIMDHWTFTDAEVFKLWIAILLRTRYDEGAKQMLYKGKLYTIEYGEVAFGRGAWAKEFGISEGKVRHSINKFIEDGMIERSEKSDNTLTIFVVKNYVKYNQRNDHGSSLEAVVSEENESHRNNQRTTSGRPADDQRTTGNKEIKIDKIERKVSLSDQISMTPAQLKAATSQYSNAFEVFWKLYPKKIGKAAAFVSWTKRIKSGEFAESIYEATRNYVEFCERSETGMTYMKNPANFIGDEMHYCDFIEGVPDAAEVSANKRVSKYVGED